MADVMDSVTEIARRLAPARASLDPDAALSEQGFDSLVMVELVTTLEERFQVRFASHELHSDAFGTLNAVADSVRSALERRTSGSR